VAQVHFFEARPKSRASEPSAVHPGFGPAERLHIPASPLPSSEFLQSSAFNLNSHRGVSQAIRARSERTGSAGYRWSVVLVGPRRRVLAAPTRAVVFSPEGMLTWIRIRRVLHRSAAVCLAFVLFFASLASGAAEALNKRATGMSCCRTKGKGCCPKKHTSSAPAFSAKPCSSDCCDQGPGVSVRGATVPKGRATAMPAMHPAGISSTAEVSRSSVVSSYNLRQRPPPSNLFI
jgi:hypothetical protein